MCRFFTHFYNACAHVITHIRLCNRGVRCDPDEVHFKWNSTLCVRCLEGPPLPHPSANVREFRCRYFLRRLIIQERAGLAEDLGRMALVNVLDEGGNVFEQDEEDQDPTPPGMQPIRYFMNGHRFSIDGDLLTEIDPSNLASENQMCVICGSRMGVPNAEGIFEMPICLPCDPRHIFGKNCILEWLTKNRSCPICREHFRFPRQRASVRDRGYEEAGQRRVQELGERHRLLIQELGYEPQILQNLESINEVNLRALRPDFTMEVHSPIELLRPSQTPVRASSFSEVVMQRSRQLEVSNPQQPLQAMLPALGHGNPFSGGHPTPPQQPSQALPPGLGDVYPAPGGYPSPPQVTPPGTTIATFLPPEYEQYLRSINSPLVDMNLPPGVSFPGAPNPPAQQPQQRLNSRRHHHRRR